MAEGKKLPCVDVIELGPWASIAAANIMAQGPIDVNRKAIVLASEAAKVNIMIDGRPVAVTARLYVEREPIGDDEAAKVAAVKADRDEAAKTKADAEQRKREREIAAAVNYTNQGHAAGVKALGDLAPALNVLANVAKQFKGAGE